MGPSIKVSGVGVGSQRLAQDVVGLLLSRIKNGGGEAWVIARSEDSLLVVSERVDLCADICGAEVGQGATVTVELVE